MVCKILPILQNLLYLFRRQGTERMALLGNIEVQSFIEWLPKINLNEFEWSAFGYGLEAQVLRGVLAPSWSYWPVSLPSLGGGSVSDFGCGSAEICRNMVAESDFILHWAKPMSCSFRVPIQLDSNNSMDPSGTHSSHVLTPLPCSRSIALLPCRTLKKTKTKTTSCHHYLRVV